MGDFTPNASAFAHFLNLAVSHEAADAKWQSKLEHFTTSKWSGETPTKADVLDFFALLRFMLKIDPGCRPSAEEVLQHPWFARGKVLTPRNVTNTI